MKEFDFLFGLLLGEQILKHTNNLSKTLQATAMSAAEAYRVAKLCIDVFKKIRTDDDFDLFWELAKTTQNSLEVKDPALSCAHKRPRRYEDGAAEPYHPPDV